MTHPSTTSQNQVSPSTQKFDFSPPLKKDFKKNINTCRFCCCCGVLNEISGYVLLQRNSIEAASNFVGRNRLPPRLKDQILAYMCLRFKAENLNQHQLIEQLPKSICKSICQHLFLPTVKKVYLFKGISRETLLHLVRNCNLFFQCNM